MPSDSTEHTSASQRINEYARTRDVGLRDALVADHMELVERLARRFRNRGEQYDDLVQVAAIGLMKSIEGFDPTLGFEFQAYATKTMIGELKRHFRDKGWAIRAPRRVQELYLQLGVVIEELTHALGRSPTVRELARHIEVSEDEVIEALDAGHSYRSASIDAVDASGQNLGQRLGGEDAGFATTENWVVLAPLIQFLPERERQIVQLRFGEDLTQSEIAERVGVSQMQVSRLLARSLETLRVALIDTDSAPVPRSEPEPK